MPVLFSQPQNIIPSVWKRQKLTVDIESYKYYATKVLVPVPRLFCILNCAEHIVWHTNIFKISCKHPYVQFCRMTSLAASSLLPVDSSMMKLCFVVLQNSQLYLKQSKSSKSVAAQYIKNVLLFVQGLLDIVFALYIIYQQKHCVVLRTFCSCVQHELKPVDTALLQYCTQQMQKEFLFW